MLIKEIIQRVQSLYSKGVQSDDSRLSSRHIFSVLISLRSTLLTQKINKKQSVSQWNYQTLNCVELIKAMPYECPCLPQVGCEILRTKHKLPKPLQGLMDGHMLQSVTSLEGSVTFSKTTWRAKKYKRGSKYTSNKPDYFIRDEYLYVTSKKGARFISIEGLFEDFIEVDNFPNFCEEDCTDCQDCVAIFDKEFPIDRGMIKTIVEMASVELLAQFNAGKEDTSNNTRDSIVEDSK